MAKSVLVALLITLSLVAFSQNEETDLNIPVTPVSPDVSSLGKYEQMPIGYYTGIPSINIPIKTVKSKKLSNDISIRYHAGGIKVEEMASSVGLGWSLDYGGSVSRQVRGLPDDLPVIGFLWNLFDPSDFFDLTSEADRKETMADVILRESDLEPDIFSFNIQGYSGEFFFDENGGLHLKSHQDIKIEPLFTTPQQYINGWIITVPDGIKYYFGVSLNEARSAKEKSQVTIYGPNRNQILEDHTTSWFLLDIVDTNELDQINFYYKNQIATVCTKSAERRIWTLSGSQPECENEIAKSYFSKSINSTVRIDSISALDFSLKFDFLNGREDFVNNKALDAVRVFNHNNQLISKFVFHHSYFVSSSSGLYSTPCASNAERTKRLKLDSLVEENTWGDRLPPYIFYYESTLLPERFSASVDYWGYFNGKSNSGLLPSFTYNIGGNNIFFSGADRTSDPAKAVASVLYKIKYPLGGETEFEYEGNKITVSSIMPLPNTSDGDQLFVGGIRVKKMAVRDDNGGVSIVKYRYVRFDDPSKSSGQITASPVMGWQQVNCGPCNQFIIASVSQYPLATTKSGYVGYTNVEEVFGENAENGFSRYHFFFTYDIDNYSRDYPFPPTDNLERLRGRLLKKEDFNSGAVLLKDIVNTYTVSNSYHNSGISGIKVSGVPDLIGRLCYTEYSVSGDWSYLSSSAETTYDGSNAVTVTTSYLFDRPTSHVLPTEIQKSNSDGRVTRVLKKYPPDNASIFTEPFAAEALAAKTEMASTDRYMIGVVLEEETILNEGPTNTTISKFRNNFYLMGDDILYRSKEHGTSNNNYRTSYTIDDYNALGNPLQVTQYNSSPETYVWSADSRYLLAHVKNALSNQVYYTSFEEETSGVANGGKTGEKYKTGGFSISLSGLSAGEYKLSYFKLEDSIWKFYLDDRTVTGSSFSETLSGDIDEIRFYPKGAEVQTYTYKPGYGILTHTDPGGQTSYYVYDNFRRLSLIKDDNGNILKTFTYNYKK